MKSVDLGLLSAGVALALSLGGGLLVLLDFPVPDRWPHAREPEAPTVDDQVRALEEIAEEARSRKRVEYEAFWTRVDDVDARIRRLERKMEELDRVVTQERARR